MYVGRQRGRIDHQGVVAGRQVGKSERSVVRGRRKLLAWPLQLEDDTADALLVGIADTVPIGIEVNDPAERGVRDEGKLDVRTGTVCDLHGDAGLGRDQAHRDGVAIKCQAVLALPQCVDGQPPVAIRDRSPTTFDPHDDTRHTRLIGILSAVLVAILKHDALEPAVWNDPIGHDRITVLDRKTRGRTSGGVELYSRPHRKARATRQGRRHAQLDYRLAELGRQGKHVVLQLSDQIELARQSKAPTRSDAPALCGPNLARNLRPGRQSRFQRVHSLQSECGAAARGTGEQIRRVVLVGGQRECPPVLRVECRGLRPDVPRTHPCRDIIGEACPQRDPPSGGRAEAHQQVVGLSVRQTAGAAVEQRGAAGDRPAGVRHIRELQQRAAAASEQRRVPDRREVCTHHQVAEGC